MIKWFHFHTQKSSHHSKNPAWPPPTWQSSVPCWSRAGRGPLSLPCRLEADRPTNIRGRESRWKDGVCTKEGVVNTCKGGQGQSIRTLEKAVLELILGELGLPWWSESGRGQEQLCRQRPCRAHRPQTWDILVCSAVCKQQAAQLESGVKESQQGLSQGWAKCQVWHAILRRLGLSLEIAESHWQIFSEEEHDWIGPFVTWKAESKMFLEGMTPSTWYQVGWEERVQI